MNQREFLRDAAKLGFELVGHTGSGHLRLRSDTCHYTAPATPSDRMSWRNCLADMERLSGRRLPRQKSGKHRYRVSPKGTTCKTFSPTPALIRDAVDDLMAQARQARAAAQAIAARERHRHDIEALMRPGFGR